MVENETKIQKMKVLRITLKETSLGYRHSQGITFGERDGPNEKSHRRHERFYEESKLCG